MCRGRKRSEHRAALSGDFSLVIELFYYSTGSIVASVEQCLAGSCSIPTTVGNVPLGTKFTYEINYSHEVLSVSIERRHADESEQPNPRCRRVFQGRRLRPEHHRAICNLVLCTQRVPRSAGEIFSAALLDKNSGRSAPDRAAEVRPRAKLSDTIRKNEFIAHGRAEHHGWRLFMRLKEQSLETQLS
jgi:hypothetical protein